MATPREESPKPSVPELMRAALSGARRSRPDDDAEDAAQDALLALATRSEPPQNPRATAYWLGRRRGIDIGRKRQREELTVPEELVPVVSNSEVSVEDLVVARERTFEMLAIARQLLTSDEFNAIVFLFLQGGTISDAARYLAETTGRSFESCRTHTRRAQEKMKRRLENTP